MKWTKAQRNKITGRVNGPEMRQAISKGVLKNTTPEQRSAIGRIARAAWTEASTRSQIAKLRGQKHSTQTKEKRAATLRGRNWVTNGEINRKLNLCERLPNGWWIGTVGISPPSGWKHSESAKAKMRAYERTLEHRAKLSWKRQGRTPPHLGFKGVGDHCKQIVCLETGAIFKSLGLASDWLKSAGISTARDCSGGLSLACNGFKSKAYGYTWKFC